MIGTSAAFLTTNLIAPMLTIGSNNFEKVAYAAGIELSAIQEGL